MDPTQDQAEAKRLMASVRAALDRIETEFQLGRQQTSQTQTPQNESGDKSA